jgi:hypothetical protein
VVLCWCETKKTKEKTIMSKKPEHGEWWETEDGDRVYVIGFRRGGDIIWESQTHGIDWGIVDTTDWKHLPDCTGFDWVKPAPEPSMMSVRLRKYVEPNGRGDFMFLRTDTDHKSHGYTPVNEWMQIEVPVSG